MPDLNPWVVLVIGVILIIVGLIAAALGVGWWGLRRALRKGRTCPECGLWGTELEILIHHVREHERG